jgi:hypothetical protein
MFKLPVLFSTVGELGSNGYVILAGVTMRFRTSTVETSISGRGNGILRRDATFGWCGVGDCHNFVDSLWRRRVLRGSGYVQLGRQNTKCLLLLLTGVGDPKRFGFRCCPFLWENLGPREVVVGGNGAPVGFLITRRPGNLRHLWIALPTILSRRRHFIISLTCPAHCRVHGKARRLLQRSRFGRPYTAFRKQAESGLAPSITDRLAIFSLSWSELAELLELVKAVLSLPHAFRTSNPQTNCSLSPIHPHSASLSLPTPPFSSIQT